MSLIHWKSDTNVPMQRRVGASPLGILQEEINQLFDDFFTPQATTTSRMPGLFNFERSWTPALDVVETDTGFALHAECPGMEAGDIQVEVADGVLTLKGEKKANKEEKGENYLRRETSYGSFRRSVALPETADFDKAEASFKNGVLTLQVPKKAETAKTTKTIKVKAAA